MALHFREEAFKLQEQENRMDVQSEKEMEEGMKANFEAQQKVREEDEERRIKPTEELASMAPHHPGKIQLQH